MTKTHDLLVSGCLSRFQRRSAGWPVVLALAARATAHRELGHAGNLEGDPVELQAPVHHAGSLRGSGQALSVRITFMSPACSHNHWQLYSQTSLKWLFIVKSGPLFTTEFFIFTKDYVKMLSNSMNIHVLPPNTIRLIPNQIYLNLTFRKWGQFSVWRCVFSFKRLLIPRKRTV